MKRAHKLPRFLLLTLLIVTTLGGGCSLIRPKPILSENNNVSISQKDLVQDYEKARKEHLKAQTKATRKMMRQMKRRSRKLNRKFKH